MHVSRFVRMSRIQSTIMLWFVCTLAACGCRIHSEDEKLLDATKAAHNKMTAKEKAEAGINGAAAGDDRGNKETVKPWGGWWAWNRIGRVTYSVLNMRSETEKAKRRQFLGPMRRLTGCHRIGWPSCNMEHLRRSLPKVGILK